MVEEEKNKEMSYTEDEKVIRVHWCFSCVSEEQKIATRVATQPVLRAVFMTEDIEAGETSARR